MNEEKIAKRVADRHITAGMALPMDVIKKYNLPRNWWGFFIYSGGKPTRAKWYRIMEDVEADPDVMKPWGVALYRFKKAINSNDKERMLDRLYSLLAANGRDDLSERLEDMPVNKIYEVFERALDIATGGIKELLKSIIRGLEKRGIL